MIYNPKYYYFWVINNINITQWLIKITDWLIYFGQTILDAQKDTLKRIDFLIEKTIFFDNHTNQLNERQLKVVKRLFDVGHTGFISGLSADNYREITKTSTSTRDLNDMVEKQILIKKGILRSTRYFLNIKMV